AADKVGPACDIYGLGMTALFAVKGARLTKRALRDPAGELAAVTGQAAVKAEILRAIEWDPDERHASAAAFADALRAAQGGRPPIAQAADVPTPLVSAVPRDVKPSNILLDADRDALLTDMDLMRADDASGGTSTGASVGLVWVEVPPGSFWMGSSKDEGHPVYDSEAYDDELPPFRLEMSTAYRIARHPTCNADYAVFLKATGRAPPAEWANKRLNAPAQPVVGVDWDDARAFCAWLDTTAVVPAGWRADLPTEAEWEYAARGPDGWRYPWGNAPPDAERADYLDPPGGRTANQAMDDLGKGGPQPVGLHSTGASRWGVEEMAGTVWEWCLDAWQAKRTAPLSTSVDTSAPRVIRGGSWADLPGYLRCARRLGGHPRHRFPNLGFRVVCRVPRAPD
ncbi:MAG: SUMF1/EgtB/PvdO family nonheme iron enzyme, partial [Myxococcales bacterium]|nr:SUMF1/EgtB/PvdO family nonheme iron enzyme [Myxococcales bacterium]